MATGHYEEGYDLKKKPSLEILRSLLSNFEISPENRVICSLKKWKMLYFYLSFFSILYTLVLFFYYYFHYCRES